MVIYIILSLLSSLVQGQGFNPQGLSEVTRLDPFKTAKTIPKVKPMDCLKAKTSNLPYQLLSSIVLTDKAKSLAQLSHQSIKVNIKEGDEVSEFKVLKIERMRVFIKNKQNQECEVIKAEYENTK